MEYLAWPAAVFVFAIVFLIMFRKNIAGCIDKIRKIERGGVSISTDQVQALPDAKALTETKASGFHELMDSVSSQLLRQQEATIRDALKNKGITNDQEAVKILTRAVASSSLTLRWTNLDRTIFGSQLELLVAINASPSGFSIQQIKGFYDSAVQRFSVAYKNYSFEQWLSFLEKERVIVKGDNGYQITIDGKEFMTWLVQAGRTHPHPN